jgi:hypothetical protein
MCTNPKYQRLAATIVEEELELAATIVQEELKLVAPFLPINRHRKRERRVWGVESKANREEERKRGCQGQQPQVQQ